MLSTFINRELIERFSTLRLPAAINQLTVTPVNCYIIVRLWLVNQGNPPCLQPFRIFV
jgi:hypothetical protein